MIEYFVLYDSEDNCIGTYDRKQLKEFINTNRRTFDCIISRLKKGAHKHIRVKGKLYSVYIYME